MRQETRLGIKEGRGRERRHIISQAFRGISSHSRSGAVHSGHSDSHTPSWPRIQRRHYERGPQKGYGLKWKIRRSGRFDEPDEFVGERRLMILVVRVDIAGRHECKLILSSSTTGRAVKCWLMLQHGGLTLPEDARVQRRTCEDTLDTH